MDAREQTIQEMAAARGAHRARTLIHQGATREAPNGAILREGDHVVAVDSHGRAISAAGLDQLEAGRVYRDVETNEQLALVGGVLKVI